MADTPTFQDLLAEFSDEVFVGRSEQLALFERALTAPRPPFLILAISGQGGVGKTTLLEHFRHMADSREVLTALVNEDQPSVLATLAHLAHQFEESGHPFNAFDERYRKYRELKQQVEADPKAPKGLLDFTLRSATRIGLRSLRRIPIGGEVADVLITPEAEDTVADQVSAWAAYVAQKFTNKDENILLLETDQELTHYFLADLNKEAQERRIVLFFDTYEKTAPYLDTWLQDLLGGKYGTFSSRVLFVIAGRYPLGQTWTRFIRAIRQVELCGFTETEAREYLKSFGIIDEAQVAQLISLSERLPVLLAFLVSAPSDVPADAASTAVERFLQGNTPEQREAALTASVPRFFNQDVLSVVLGPEAAGPAFEWLSAAHFVRPSGEGWAYHEVVRSLMLHYLRQRSAQHCAEAHGKLADYYRSRNEALGLSEDRQYQDETWRKNEVERLYHCLSQNPPQRLEEMFEVLLASYSTAMQLMTGKYKESWELFDQCSYTLAQIGDETKERTIHEWAVRLARVNDREDLGSHAWVQTATTFFKLLAESDALSKQGRSTALCMCAAIAADQSKWDLALADLSQAIQLQPTNSLYHLLCGAIHAEAKGYQAALVHLTQAILLRPEHSFSYHVRGRTYLEMKDYPAALTDFSKAIQLRPDDSDSYHWRGRTYLEMKDYPTALTDFSKAVQVRPNDNDSFYWRGHTYLLMEDYSAALADFSQAIQLQPNDRYYFHWRGRTYLEMKDYPAALTDFSRAIQLQPDNRNSYHWRGCTYYEMKDYPAALADFSQAIQLQLDDSYSYHWRGRTYYEMKDYPTALADFSQAIRLRPEGDYSYHWRGRAYFMMGDYPPALADFSKAIELRPDDYYSFYWRGRTYFGMKDHSAALADFSKAIELQPDNPRSYSRRGGIYFDMEDYPAALADFSKAIELQPDDHYSFYWRGRTHFEMADYTAALADFSQAIELDPQDAKAYYSRGATYANLGKYDKALEEYGKAREGYDKALAAYLEAERNLPGDTADRREQLCDAFVRLGAGLRRLGQWKGSEAACLRAMELNPNDARVWNGLGLAYRRLGQWKEAEDAYQNSIRLDPKLPHPHNNLGCLYLQMGRLEEAKEQFLECIHLLPKDALEAEVFSAVIACRQGEAQVARSHFKQAIDIWKTAWRSRLETPFDLLVCKALALLGMGDPQEAIVVLDQALKQRPPNYTLELPICDLLLAAPQPLDGLSDMEALLREAAGQ